MLKRLARISGLVLGGIVAVAVVWHVVRFELLFLGVGSSVEAPTPRLGARKSISTGSW